MSDAQTPASTTVNCPAERDPGIRLLIATAMGIAGALYCQLTPPKEALGPESDINLKAEWYLHLYGPWVCGAVAIVLAVWAFKALRRTIVADADGIVVSRKRYAWSEFNGIDASLLAEKGQLTLKRTGGNDVLLRRYQYKNFKALVELIEQKVSTESPSTEG
jgi:hypothetical protein